MGNELTRPKVTLLQSFTLVVPDMSNEMRVAIAHILNPHPDIVPSNRTPTVEAKVLLEGLADLARPCSYETMLAWMWPIADAVEYTPSESDFMRRVGALHMASVNVPWVAWTASKQRDAMLSWTKMPSVAVIVEHVMPPVRPLVRLVTALRQLARGIDTDPHMPT